jgi:hypothetical protein
MNNPCGKAVLCAVAAAGAMTMGVAWAHEEGRMTGGGSFFCSDLPTGNQRVTHGFELHCKTDDQPAPAEPNNLEINFSGGDNFHLTTLTDAFCLDTDAVQQPPNAPFDTFFGGGTGTFNGQPASIRFVFVDAGEPGTKDTALAVITLAGASAPVLNCSSATFLNNGNHQAHRLTGNK